jgi:molybdopterin converting factor small subunit
MPFSNPTAPDAAHALRILFFSTARAVTGTMETMIPCAEPLDESGLWDKLLVAHPGLGNLRDRIRLARNGRFAQTGERFEPGDEVAVIPPVSGG